MSSPADRSRLEGVADLRVTYDTGALEPGDLPPTPLAAFGAWFDAALAAGLPEVNAMTLATAAPDGTPSARTVLLKDADARGFVFFTNLGSAKGRALAANPRAALVFPWFAMHRQVVVAGDAEQVPREESEAYFRSRPRESQLGAWTSRQSEVIEDRSVLEERYLALEERFAGGDVPLPEFWGGWLIRPRTVEFWQGRPSRLHDRLRFRARSSGAGMDASMVASMVASMDDAGAWVLERLSP